eukprot:NODE_10890_length_209_cov_124.262500_g10275_i0.p1 GENE.NODE_10890_length_209_cov_124.262500_g10275_i0~~NODE_10890_length_209_cov_124.262500_g10275_i0.p1  ORF type:complete len:52 (-),score=20.25 NODE_10890_length_209_cov_124.262500_g10275_i0:53-178(-)
MGLQRGRISNKFRHRQGWVEPLEETEALSYARFSFLRFCLS